MDIKNSSDIDVKDLKVAFGKFKLWLKRIFKIITKTRRRKLLSIVMLFLFLFSFVKLFQLIFPSGSSAWWDSSWIYRKKIDFGNSGSADTNKVVSFPVDTATLISQGKMQADCDDIRITDSSGSPLDYRINPNSAAKFTAGSTTEYSSTTTQSSYSFSHTVATGSNQVLVVVINAVDDAAINVTNVTYNGTTMTEQTEVDSNDGTYHYVTSIWTLINPTATTASVAVTYDASVNSHVASAMNFTNVDQTTPVGVTASNSSNSVSSLGVTGTSLYAKSILVGGAGRQSIDSSPERLVYTYAPGKHTYEASSGGAAGELAAGGGFQYAETPGSKTMTFGLSDATSNTHMNGAFIELKSAAICNSLTTDVEVLFSSIPTGDQYIYMYYGNASAADSSSSLSDVSKVLGYKEFTDASSATISTSHTYSHTVTSGTNQTLVVVASNTSEQTGDIPIDIVSITYNGDPLVRQSFADNYTTNRNNLTEVWTLLNPDTGTNNVVITYSDNADVKGSAAMTYENTVQNYLPVANKNSGTSATTLDINLTTTKDNSLIAGGGTRHKSAAAGSATTDNVSVTSPGTEVYDERLADADVSSSISMAGGYQAAATAGSQTLQVTSLAATSWTGAAVALEPETTYDKFIPTSGPTAAAEEVSDFSIVAHWKFDEGVDNTCSGGVNDVCNSVSSSYDGTNTASWQKEDLCIQGKCLSFNGSDDVVTIANGSLIDFDTGLSHGVSASFWIKPISDGENSTGEIFDKGSHFYCRTDSESAGFVDLQCGIDLDTTDPTVNISGILKLGSWHHVEVTYGDDSDDDLLVYIDGNLFSTGDGSGAPVGTDSSNLLIGGDTSNNFHGFIDEFKIFNYQRTATEVKTDFIEGASSNGSGAVFGVSSNDPFNQGLVGYWKLDEVSGNGIDSSGFGNTLTNNGTTTFTGANFGNGSEHVPASSQYFSTASTITGIKTVSFWVNPDSTSNYFLGLTASDYITSTTGTLDLSNTTSEKIYVNGAESKTLTADTWQLVTISTETSIDANQYYLGRVGSNYFDGTIDDVRLYSRVLSPAEIKELYFWAPGPEGYWPMNENTGTTTYDRSGNSNNGTLNGTMTQDDWIPGRFGSALDFDGTDDNVQIGDSSVLDVGVSGSFSVSGWFKHSGISSNPDYIFSKSQGGTNGGYQVYMGSSGQIVMEVDDDSTWGPDDSITTPVSAGEITYVASSSAQPSTGNSVTPTIPTGSTTDDLMIAICSRGGNYGSASWLDDGAGGNGWTRLVNNFSSTGRDEVSAIFYKIHDGSETDPTFSLSDAQDQGGGVVIGTFRGVDTSSPFDVTYNNTLHYLFSENDGNPASPDITTNTDGAFAVLLLGASTRAGVWGAPSGGYTLAGNTGDTYDRYAGMAFKEIVSAGTENPAVWQNVDVYGTSESHAYTLAIKPAPSSGGVAYDDNQWHHFEAVRDIQQGYKIFMDGVQVATESAINATGSLANDDPVYLGVDDDGTSNDWAGALDEIKFYNYARSENQIIEDLNANHPMGGSPIGSQIIHYKFDESVGSVINNDISTQTSLVGSITNSVWQTTSCKFSSCLDYDGTGDYVETADATALDFTGDFTLSAWVNRETGGSISRSVISKMNSTPDGGYALHVGNDGEIYCHTHNGSSTSSSSTASNYVTTTSGWTHIAAVRNGSSCRIYVNGHDVTSTAGTHTTMTANNEPLRIGSDPGNSQYWFGDIDDVKIYNAALTPDQIKVDYNDGASINFGSGTNERADIVDGDYQSTLIGYWPMDENTGTSTTYDKSGNGYDGTLNGTMTVDDWVPAKFGSGLELDQSDDYISASSSINLANSSFTIGGWYKRSDAGDFDYLFTQGTNTDNQGLHFGYRDSNVLTFAFWNDDLDTTATYTDTNWHHLMGTYDATTNSRKIYRDGVEVASDTATADFQGTGNLAIGARVFWNNVFAGGIIDEFKVFSSALTPAQVAYEYNRGAPAAWYKLDECQGTVAYDSGSFATNGTITEGGTGANDGGVGTCNSGNGDEMWDNGTNGVFNSALDFDGTDDKVAITSNAFDVGTGDFTISLWTQVDDSNDNDRIFSVGNSNHFEIWMPTDGRILAIAGNSSSSRVTCSSNGGVSYENDGLWHHVVAVFDRDYAIKLYIDGNLQSDIETGFAAYSAIDYSLTNAEIGGYASGTSYNIDGRIDDVRFYNYALSQNQVNTVMNGGAVRFN